MRARMSPVLAMPWPFSPPMPTEKSTVAMFVIVFRQTEIVRTGKSVGSSLNVDECWRNIFNCLKATFIARKLPRAEATFCRQRATIGTQLADKMNMWPQPQLAHDPAQWLGDAHPLVEQLGSADGLASLHALADSLRTRPVASLPALREFLRGYHERVLLPYELFAIQMVFAH